MKIHVISETENLMEGQGVHTAYVDMVEILKSSDDVEVVTNSNGKGDIFHSHTYGPYYFWKGLNYKGKRILTVHVIPDSIKGSLPFWRMLYPLVRQYFKLVYSYADICIAISPMVEKAIKDLGVKSKIVRLANPLPVERWSKTKEAKSMGRVRLGISKYEFVVLGVGQMQQRKGIEDFIEIARVFPQIKFVWVGGRPFGKLTEGINRINKKIEQAPKNIQFTGLLELSKMPEMYAAADLMLFPSYQENCPLAPIEAAAAGLPVIFRNLEEYRQLYNNPYLKASNNQEFISLINELYLDKNKYQEAQQISFNLISQFDKNVIRKELIKLYTNLLEQDQFKTKDINFSQELSM